MKKKVRHEVFTFNLEKLRGSEMFEATGSESINGNAGRVHFEGTDYPALAVNFYADPDTGKIIRFTNYGETNAVFKVISIGTIKKWYRRITDFEPSKNLSENAKRQIQIAIDAFNGVGRDMSEFEKYV